MLSTETTHDIIAQSTESLDEKFAFQIKKTKNSEIAYPDKGMINSSFKFYLYHKECQETFGVMQFNTACTL